jgi:CRP-like cAMP-binding protein
MATPPAISVDRLRDVAVLEGLAEDDLVRIVAAGRERRIATGEFLFHQGERATQFHVVLEGQLETTREVAGEQVLLMSHGPGGFLGAMALLT